MSTTINKQFSFLPNGKPVSTLKNAARKMFKSGDAESLSFAKNAISQSLFNQPYNKVVKGVDESSPQIIDSVLYVPVTIDLMNFDKQGSFNYYVAINDKLVSLAVDCSFTLELDKPFVQDLKSSDFEKIAGGWIVTLPDNKFLEIKVSDEGLVVDYYANSGECCLDSSYVFFDEIFDDWGQFDYLNNVSIDDVQAASDLGHENDEAMTTLYVIGGVHVILFSCWLIEKDGRVFTKSEIFSELMLNDDASKSEFFDWIKGKYVERYDDLSLPSTPYFGIESESGEILGEVFDTIPKTLSERALDAARTFIQE